MFCSELWAWLKCLSTCLGVMVHHCCWTEFETYILQLNLYSAKNKVTYFAHLRKQCHNSKFVIFQEKLLKVLKCYNFLWVQWQHNCSSVASFTNCNMTLYLLKVHLHTFLSTPITQKCQILSCDTLVANERFTEYLR